MFKTMLRMWAAIAFIMATCIVISIMLDLFNRAVERDFNTVAVIGLSITLVGLGASIWKVMNDKNNH